MSMLLDLSRFRGGVERIDRRVAPEALVRRPRIFGSPRRWSSGPNCRKDAKQGSAGGHGVRPDLEVPCGRCLEPYVIPVDSAFDLLFLPISDVAAAPARASDEIQADDDGAVVLQERRDRSGRGDARAVLSRAADEAALPRGLQGLCPVCGVNRNTETVRASAEWVDPRMEALRSVEQKDH